MTQKDGPTASEIQVGVLSFNEKIKYIEGTFTQKCLRVFIAFLKVVLTKVPNCATIIVSHNLNIVHVSGKQSLVKGVSFFPHTH